MSDAHIPASTSNPEEINIFILSDSAGETGTKLAQAAMAQYPGLEFTIFRRTFISDIDHLKKVMNDVKVQNGIVIFSLVKDPLRDYCTEFCMENNLFYMNILNPLVSEIQRRTKVAPSGERGALHHLNENYFKRIKAMEFAVKYDDGKDPRGFLKADLVILGVSRTSKTPVSLFLANKNLRVANLPIVPNAHIPEQIYQVDPSKIVGLTNDPAVLLNIRRERLRSYGLDPDTAYSDMDKIREELAFADDLYRKLGCVVINVAKLSIEETAALIMEKLHLEDHSYSGADQRSD